MQSILAGKLAFPPSRIAVYWEKVLRIFGVERNYKRSLLYRKVQSRPSRIAIVLDEVTFSTTVTDV